MKTKDEQEKRLAEFVSDLKVKGFTDYLIRRYGPHADCKYHSDNWEGRYLLLDGSVTLEIAGKVRSFSAGDTYEMLPQTLHREVFGPEGANLVVARRRIPELPFNELDDAVSLAGH